MGYNIHGYTPRQGDIIWVKFDPSVGREIQKKRPALVLSSNNYNQATGFIVVCPITNTKKRGFVEIHQNQKTTGYMNVMQLKTFDYISKKREVEYIEYLNDEDMAVVVQIVGSIFKFEKIIESDE